MYLPLRQAEATSDSEKGRNYEIQSTEDMSDELKRWKRSFWIVSALFTFMLLAGMAELGKLEQTVKAQCVCGIPNGAASAKETLKVDAFFPEIPREKVVFQPNQSYTDEFPGTLREPTVWDRLIPDGAGFVAVSDPETYDLAGGFPIADESSSVPKESYSIAMFHQLHCLATIKSAFGPRDHGAHQHLGHCFDYLRQSIMCAGDTTLEKAVVRDGVKKPEVDGWGVEHVCRNWDVIWQFAYQNRVGNKSGIS